MPMDGQPYFPPGHRGSILLASRLPQNSEEPPHACHPVHAALSVPVALRCPAAREKGVLAFGNLLDQHGESPDTVITGPVWSMTPVVDYLISLSAAGKVYAENLVDFSTLARGNAALAPWHGWDGRLPADVMQLMREKERALKAGSLVLNPSTERPTGD